MGYKTTDALMRHLRKSGIAIEGAMKQCLKLDIGLPYVNFKKFLINVEFFQGVLYTTVDNWGMCLRTHT